MKKFANPLIACLLLLFATCSVFAQAQPSSTAPESVRRENCAKQTAYGDPRISWVQLLPDIGCDQKEIWTFPRRMVKGENLVATFGVIAATAELAASDRYTEGPLRTAKSFHTFNNVFTSANSDLMIALVPSAMYVMGLATHDSYAKKSALLAGEAAADVEVVDIALKSVTQRLRPRAVPASGNLGDTWFEYGKASIVNGSFPSGHAIASFAIAAVIAGRYGRHRWVPWVAYGVAGLISFSRLPAGEHFPSDVFMGAALGYSIGRFVGLQ